MSSPNEDAMAQGERLQKATENQIEAIRENRNLTPEGKRQGMARAVLAAREKMVQIRGNRGAENQTAMADAYRAAFGQPTDTIEAMSYRDALGRAADLTESETPGTALRTEMTRALARGDAIMAKAIASTAWDAHAAGDRTFDDVINDYGESDPALETKLKTLVAAHDNAGANMMMGWSFLIGLPPELAGYNLADVADQGEPANQLDDIMSIFAPRTDAPANLGGGRAARIIG